jgi:membrane protease YdiL (CAAX protease family)
VPAVGVVVAVLAGYNVLGNLALPAAWYVPANLALAAGLLGLARAVGVSWTELGLGRSNLARGVAFGALAFGVVAVALVVAALVPATRPLFDDARAADVTGAALAYHTLIRIPLGTVVLEETAFRGVLLALLWRVTSVGRAVAWSSALFGLWHVVPTIEALHANGLTPTIPVVSAAVVATAAAGVVFCWLRLRSGSLLAPALAHVATNSIALLIASAILADGS